MADAIYIYVYYDFGSQTIGICPKRGKLYAKIPGKNRCSRSESGILQPASRTGHGICQTFEPIPEVFGRMSVSFP